jgi:hypothetical protein
LPISDLQIILRPHIVRFSRIAWPIYAHYLELPDSHRLAYDARAEANILHRYMVENAKRQFEGVPGAQFLETNGFHLGIDGAGYGIDGAAICRFKKLDDNGQSSNYPTDRAEALRKNEQLKGLPEDATFVDLGYTLNDLRTSIREVQVVRVFDSAVIFSIPRLEEQEPGSQLPLIGPTITPPRFEVIRPRRTSEDEGRS